MPNIGENDYRMGARERLDEAYLLISNKQFSGGIYLAGRAVEGMLRAVIWKQDPDYAAGRKSLETGHDLRELVRLIRNLGALRGTSFGDEITRGVQRIARLWSNNMRFLPRSVINRIWYDAGYVGGKRTLKAATQEYFIACTSIVRQCEALWQGRSESRSEESARS